MTGALAVKGFNEISYDELMDVNGGWSWVEWGEAAGGGALLGAIGGVGLGGIGAGPGAIAGGCVGAMSYSLSELFKVVNGSH